MPAFLKLYIFTSSYTLIVVQEFAQTLVMTVVLSPAQASFKKTDYPPSVEEGGGYEYHLEDNSFVVFAHCLLRVTGTSPEGFFISLMSMKRGYQIFSVVHVGNLLQLGMHKGLLEISEAVSWNRKLNMYSGS